VQRDTDINGEEEREGGGADCERESLKKVGACILTGLSFRVVIVFIPKNRKEAWALKRASFPNVYFTTIQTKHKAYNYCKRKLGSRDSIQIN